MNQQDKSRVLAEILCYLLNNDNDERLLNKILENKSGITQSRKITLEEIDEATYYWRRQRLWSPSM